MILLTILSIALLAGAAAGYNQYTQVDAERKRREDLIRRGYIL